MAQTMRLSIEDKANYVYYKSKMNKRLMASIEDSANEAARRINSNADLNTTRELIGIENAAHEIAESQMEAAYIIDASIQASTDRIIAGQDKNTNRIIDSLEDLRALFDAKLSETIFLLEEQRDILKEILKVLQLPLTTQAKELKEMAENAFKKGTRSEDFVERARWFDNAIRDFEKSKEYNPYDFTIYLALGHIFLNEKTNNTEALKNFKDAAFYAKDYLYYKSSSLLYAGITNYKLGLYSEAYDITSEAIKLYPALSEAHYRCAQYCSKLGKYDEAINYLRTAIDADRGYSLKALVEEDFTPMSGKFKILMEDITREEKKKADQEFKKSNQLTKKFAMIGVSNDVKEKLRDPITLINSGTYLNYRDAKYKAKAYQKILVDSLIPMLSGQISENELSISKVKNELARVLPPLHLAEMNLAKYIPIVFISGIVISWYGWNTEGWELEYMEVSSLMRTVFWIAKPVFLIGLAAVFIYITRYIPLRNELKKIDPQLSLLEKESTKNRNHMTIVETEKSKLNIDKVAELFNYIDYEKYLRKTYG
jgi:tetratricopeptide (TPR) repeat protein